MVFVLFDIVKDEGFLYELLVMKRVQFLLITAMRVWGSGFRVSGLGFLVYGLGFRV